MNTVITSFIKLTNQKMLDLADYVHVQMTINAGTFPNPEPSIAQYLSLGNIFKNAYEEAKSRSKYAIAARNQAREILNAATSQIAFYVSNIADGNRDTAQLSGLPLMKEKKPIHYLEAPLDFRILGNMLEGSTGFRWKAVHGAKTYIGYISMDSGITWAQNFMTTGARVTVSGLTSGSRVQFKVYAIGSRSNQSDFSVPFTAKVA